MAAGATRTRIDADPASGVWVCDSARHQGQKGWFTVGGTSASAPMWAGRAVASALVNAPYVYGNNISYRDITSGNNGASCLVGFDLCTGRVSWINEERRRSRHTATTGRDASPGHSTPSAIVKLNRPHLQRSSKPMSQINHDTAPFEANWESLTRGYTVPTWYQDAKFGIFIHWGVYAVPAFGNEWYPRNMYQQGSPEFAHHVATYGPQATFGYKDFIPRLTAANYDPAAWARLFKAAGARYVVPVAEHHDGFAMYDSAHTEWCAARMGPKRDVVGELAEAVRAEGLVFGVSYHRAENWFFYDGGRQFPSDVQDDRYRGLYGPARQKDSDHHDFHSPNGPDAAFLETWLTRACEIVDKYRPQVFWFDWWIQHDAFRPYLPRFAAYYYNAAHAWGAWPASGAAINYKYGAFPDDVGVFDVERGQLAGMRPRFWQTDTAVARNSWGYTTRQDYKDPGTIVGDLVDIVSKNGTLLLNIGPRADGSIQAGDERILRAIGGWLAVNGEAIYETRPWERFGEGPTEVRDGAFTDTQRAGFTSRDIRFTRGADALYAICLGWPEADMTITSLGAGSALDARKIAGITMLGADQPLRWEQDAAGLRVTPPATRPCDYAYTLKIALRDGA